MELSILKELVEQRHSQRGIAKALGVSQATVKHWLKKYNLKTSHVPTRSDKRTCPKCQVEKDGSNFYKRAGQGKRNGTLGGYCKSCNNQYCANRLVEVKVRMVKYKGSECERCHLKLEDTHCSVFDFHHINPTEKDPNFNRIKFQSWSVIQKEIDRCSLLCSNCHRLTHAEMRIAPMV